MLFGTIPMNKDGDGKGVVSFVVGDWFKMTEKVSNPQTLKPWEKLFSRFFEREFRYQLALKVPSNPQALDRFKSSNPNPQTSCAPPALHRWQSAISVNHVLLAAGCRKIRGLL